MHVVVTRPKADAEPLKQEIENLGCRVSASPLIEIAFSEIDPAELSRATALIATSRNALRALASSRVRDLATSLPIFVVGPGTAAAARQMGFKDINEGPGKAADLIPLLKAQPADQKFVHLSGDVLAFDLKRALAEVGVKITELPVYRSVAATALAPEVTAALVRHDIDAVVLMSPRTAEVWVDLATRLIATAELAGIVYLCLSPAVADVLQQRLAGANTLVSDLPDREHVLALVKRLAAASKGE
jgi:uroporphyrinogen-III synthase